MTPYQARIAASKAAMEARVIETARDARSKGMSSQEFAALIRQTQHVTITDGWARRLMGEDQ